MRPEVAHAACGVPEAGQLGERTAEGGVVLFDLDGVLTRKDTFATLVTRRLRTSPWRLLLAVPALPLLALTVLWPRWRGPVSRYLVRIALLAASPESTRMVTTDLAREFVATPQWLNSPGLTAARRHLDSGDRVVVVTATEEQLARTLLDHLGLTAAEVIGSRVAPAALGAWLRPHNYGGAKYEALRARDVPRPWRVMYTDSWADAPVLRHVEQVVLVRPSPSLLRRARRRLAVPVVPLPGRSGR